VASVDPRVQVVAAVEDPTAETEAMRPGTEVSPVPKGGDGCAQQLRCLGDGEQVGTWVVLEGWTGWAGMVVSGTGRLWFDLQLDKAPFRAD
jgi:hypothetical protein